MDALTSGFSSSVQLPVVVIIIVFVAGVMMGFQLGLVMGPNRTEWWYFFRDVASSFIASSYGHPEMASQVSALASRPPSSSIMSGLLGLLPMVVPATLAMRAQR